MSVETPTIAAAAPRHLCTDCGISRTSDAARCGRACQFVRPDYVTLEQRVHGRARDAGRADKLLFGSFRRMVRATVTPRRDGAQWSGIATRLGERLLETGQVDAIPTVAPDATDRWKPVPVLVTRVEMKAVETVLHLRRQEPRRLKSMIPPHVWDLVRPYGLAPRRDEQAEAPRDGA